MGVIGPKGLGEVICNPSQVAEAMGFKVVYRHLGCIALMASWGHQFHVKLTHVADVVLRCFRHFTVNNMFLWCDACSLQAEQ